MKLSPLKATFLFVFFVFSFAVTRDVLASREKFSTTAVRNSLPSIAQTEATPTATQAPTLVSTPTPPKYYFPLTLSQPTLTPTPSPTPDATQPGDSFEEPYNKLICASPKAAIPDDDTNGISSTITSSDQRYIGDLDVRVAVNHTWIGDIVVSLIHLNTGTSQVLIDRPGYPAAATGCSYDNIAAILDDEITSSVEGKCSPGGPVTSTAISGIYKPNEPLSAFYGEQFSGEWTLNVSDRFQSDTGSFISWCLAAKLSDQPQSPPSTPEPPQLPNQASVSGLSGKKQALPLDCESRSAIDWAAHFGKSIGEIAFFNNLPLSENPDTGFVGDVNGIWGQIPPADYGIHAGPVAALLRDYGVEAYAHRPLSWDNLRAEVAAGRPVIVWIVYSVDNGIPEFFTPPDNHTTVVAKYEHTVIVGGYTQTSVTYLNGSTLYTVGKDQFLDSWSVMGNMAVTARP